MNKLGIVVFGVTSNLAQLKLLPALFELWRRGNIDKNVSIIGLSHRERSEEEMKNIFRESLKNRKLVFDEDLFENFWQCFTFFSGNLDEKKIYEKTAKELLKENIENVIFYLAVHPNLYEGIFENLKKCSLNKNTKGFVKVMIEKPIGSDFVSAKKLNDLMSKYFLESQIFRIDHYLIKETIQNILMFRFHNKIFEALWNKNMIDHIQVTAAEDFGVEMRNAYYDSVGALKDMGQSHVLQMIALILMKKPVCFDNKEITAERMSVFNNLVPCPETLVLGQYENYSKEKLSTDTFFAFKTELNIKEFKGVPIYVRSGKKLKSTATEISVVFKNEADRDPNVLIFRIQPNEGIVLEMAVKKPGLEMKSEKATMQFCYHQLGKLSEAYEKLLVDAINGEQTYFNDAVEVEAQWKFIDALNAKKSKISIYNPGTWGPKEADELIERDGRKWLEPSLALCRI
ncbi:MAG: glucose-6-phosphate dehydrogenase [Candidatus Shapirobacteria bacterium]|jgi:glucose-6-phosphate 1-dehydrogenase